MRRKLFIAYLEFIKRTGMVGKGRTLNILSGPLKGKKWYFKKDSSNQYILGIYEQELIEFSLGLMRKQKNPVVYDIGAHHGYFSLLCSAFDQSTVYAFEPLPSNFDVLQKNLKANHIEGQLLNIAISDKPGSVEFSLSPNSFANTYKSESSMIRNGHETIKVQTDSIDNLVFQGQLKPPTYLKVDVEGAELDLLKGAHKTLTVHDPIIQLSTHDCHVPGITDLCLLELEKLGYKPFRNKEVKAQGHADFFLSKN
ncbi:MAG: FkbM family methyltransferase [Flavobacteriales bacterium]|nr:FkbM family methyltransferase [Flavobacteriales bacterium]